MCMPNFIELAQLGKKVMAGELKRRENNEKQEEEKKN